MTLALLALALSADPAYLRPGRDASASVAIACPQQPVVVPSAGQVEDLRQDGGSWRGRYRPPPPGVPRVALLAVFCGEEPGLLPIPLWGEGDAEVHARPRSVVEVRIGEELFGPLRTDAQGVARVPVVVPPGVNFAYQGKRPIDLHVPATPTVHLAGLEKALAADAARSAPLFAFAVDRAGAPLSSAALRLTATRGKLSAAEEVAPGIYRFSWSFEPGPAGEAWAEATVEGDPAPARVSLRLTAGPPASIELVADRSEVVAGDGPLRLRALVLDAAGNPANGALTAAATLGQVRIAPAGPGAHDLEVQVPGALGGGRELGVSASAGAARGEIRVALRPAPPARVDVRAARPKVVADGRTGVRVEVRALDRFGNEVTEPPAGTADRGSLTAPARTGSGWESTFVPPLLHDRGSAVVAMRTGSVAGTTRIELDPAVRPVAVSARAGVFTNFHEVTGPSGGLVAAIRRDGWAGQIGAQLSIDAIGWSSADKVTTSAGPRVVSTRLAVLLTGLGAEWRRPLSDRVAAWVAGGPLLAWAAARTELGGDSLRDRGLSAGAQAGAGAELRAWRGRALVELRWVWVRPFSLVNLQGPLHGLCASLGYRLELF